MSTPQNPPWRRTRAGCKWEVRAARATLTRRTSRARKHPTALHRLIVCCRITASPLSRTLPRLAGGITPANAQEYLGAGASHVIVTSYVFRDGAVDWARLAEVVAAVGGREHLVLDLSCRKRRRAAAPAATATAGSEDEYVVVTDRWQKFTDVVVDADSLTRLAAYCSEFLVHGVDVEGLRAGIEVRCVDERGREPLTNPHTNATLVPCLPHCASPSTHAG